MQIRSLRTSQYDWQAPMGCGVATMTWIHQFVTMSAKQKQQSRLDSDARSDTRIALLDQWLQIACYIYNLPILDQLRNRKREGMTIAPLEVYRLHRMFHGTLTKIPTLELAGVLSKDEDVVRQLIRSGEFLKIVETKEKRRTDEIAKSYEDDYINSGTMTTLTLAISKLAEFAKRPENGIVGAAFCCRVYASAILMRSRPVELGGDGGLSIYWVDSHKNRASDGLRPRSDMLAKDVSGIYIEFPDEASLCDYIMSLYPSSLDSTGTKKRGVDAMTPKSSSGPRLTEADCFDLVGFGPSDTASYWTTADMHELLRSFDGWRLKCLESNERLRDLYETVARQLYAPSPGAAVVAIRATDEED